MVVNGSKVQGHAPARMHLGDFLREALRMTGTNLSCEHGVCGACTVLLDGQPIRSCITFAVACSGRQITTIEGYEDDPLMARLRTAFTENHALQCGYCTPGMLATARDIVLRLPDADEKRVRIELSGNICRCTGYQGITEAVMSVLEDLHKTPDAAIDTLRTAAMLDKGQGKGTAPATASQVFTHFAAATDTTRPAATTQEGAAGRKSSQTPDHAGNSGRGTQVSGGFDVPFPVEVVWTFMTDLARVAACLPGAVIEDCDGQRVQGRIAVKFGPMSAAFKGEADLTLNADEKSAVLHGTGHDTVSQSRARGDVGWRIVAREDGAGAHVEVNLRYALQGPLAQFSRSGLVQDFVKRMIADFGRNVSHRLAHPTDGSALPQAQLHPLRLFLSVVWARLGRLLGRAAKP